MNIKKETFKKFSQTQILLAGIVLTLAALQTFSTTAFAVEIQEFVSKKYDIHGGWQLVEEDGQTLIRFDQDFKTKSGPDLKVFLSPLSIDVVTGKSATDGSLTLGNLQSNAGSQDYVLPEGLSISDYSSFLVHCEQYTVLWGGGNLQAVSKK